MDTKFIFDLQRFDSTYTIKLSDISGDTTFQSGGNVVATYTKSDQKLTFNATENGVTFTIDASSYTEDIEIVGTANADSINVINADVGEDKTLKVTGKGGKDTIIVEGGDTGNVFVTGENKFSCDGTYTIDYDYAADDIIVSGKNVTVGAGDNDNVTVKRGGVAQIVCDMGDTKIKVTADSAEGNQAKLTISPEYSNRYFALQDGFNGKLESLGSNEVKIKLPSTNFVLDGTSYSITNNELTCSYQEGGATKTKLFAGSYDLSDVINLSEILTTSSNWIDLVTVSENTIDISNVTNTTRFVDASGNILAEYQGGVTDSWVVKSTLVSFTDGTNTVKVISFTEGSTEATLDLDNEKKLKSVSNAASIQLIKGSIQFGEKTISISDDTDSVTIADNSITGLAVGDTVTVTGNDNTPKIYKRVTDYILYDNKAYSYTDNTKDILSAVTGDGTGTAYAVLAENVTTIDISGLTDDKLFFSGNDKVAEYKNASKTLTIENNSTITSVTGLANGGKVNYNGNTYERVGDNLFYENKFYTVNDNSNILEIANGNGTAYAKIADNAPQIDLTAADIESKTFFSKDLSKQVATYTKNDNKLEIVDKTGTYTVATSSNLKIGDTTYTKSGDGNLTIQIASGVSSLQSGTVTVKAETDSNLGIVVDGQDSDGVNVTVSESKVTAIKGLDDGETVTYDGKPYQRVNGYIFYDSKAYEVTADKNTDLLNLSDGTAYDTVTNSINISGLTENKLFFKDNAKVAEYDKNSTTLTIENNSTITSVTDLADGGKVTYNSNIYERVGNYILDGTTAYTYADTLNFSNLGTGTAYAKIADNAPHIDLTAANIESKTFFSTDLSKQVATYTAAKDNTPAALAIVDTNGNYIVATSSNLKIGDTTYTKSGDGNLTIQIAAGVSSLQSGTVIVKKTTDSNLGIVVDGQDTDGVNVTVSNSNVTSITGLADGGKVTYNSNIYERVGNYILYNNKAYSYTDETADILSAVTGTGTAYAVLAENVTTIDIIGLTENKLFFKDNVVVAEYKDGNLTVTSSTAYTVKATGTATVNGTTYTASTDTGELVISAQTNSSSLYSGTVKVTGTLNTSGGKTLTVSANGEVTVKVENGEVTSITGLDSGETVTVKENEITKTYERVGNYILHDSKAYSYTDPLNFSNLGTGTAYAVLAENVTTIDISGLTDDKLFFDAQKNLIATYSTTSGLTVTSETEYTVTATGTAKVNDTTYTASTDNGTLSIKAKKDSSSLYSGTVKVTGKLNTSDGKTLTVSDSGEVTVTVSNGNVTSITGLDSGETVTYDSTTYARTDNQVKVSKTGESEKTYTYTDKTTNLIALGGTYIQIKSSAIDLTDAGAIDGVFYGVDEAFDDSKYFAKLTVEGDKYTLSKRSDAQDITDLKITLGNGKTLDANFAAQVKTSGNVTVNGVAYNSTTGELVINTTAKSSNLYSGTVTVKAATDSGLNIEVTGTNTDGVIVKVEDSKVTSITGLNAGETVTYNSKTYTNTNNIIVDGTNYYGVDATTNITNLSQNALFKIEGVKSADGLSLNGSVVTVNSAALNATNISISGNYTLKLGNGISDPANTAAHFEHSGTTATYKSASNTAGYTLAGDSKSITYTAAVASTDLFTVNGVKSADGLALSGNVVTVGNAALNQATVSISGNYTLNLAGDVARSSSTAAHFEHSGTTAIYKSASNTAGYALAGDSKSITYTAAVASTDLFTVNGVKSANGLALSGNVVTVGNAALNQATVSISGNYKLNLAGDVVQSQSYAAGWTLSGTTAIYKSASNTAGYTLADNKINYKAASGGATLVTVTGVNSTNGLNFDSTKNILTLSGITSTVTVNGVSYTPAGTLTLSITKNSSSILSGTVKVTGNQFGVKVSDDSDGVLVTFTDGKITAVTGLNDGGSVTYGGKTYKRIDQNIFVGNTVYPYATDSSDLSNLGGGTSYVTLTDTIIDLREVAESAVFIDKNQNQIALFAEGVLKITGSDIYTVLTDGAVEIGGTKYAPAEGTLTITATKDDSYLVDGAVNLNGAMNLAGDKAMKSTAALDVTVDKDTLKNISSSKVGFTVEGSANADTINLTDSSFETVAAVYGNAGDDSITVTNIKGKGAILADAGAGNDSIVAKNGNIFANGGEGADKITISGANAFVSSDDTITVHDSGVIMSADGKQAVAVIGDLEYEVDKSINFGNNVTVEGDLAILGYDSAIYSMQFTNGDLTKMGLMLEPYNPSVTLPASTVTAYDLTIVDNKGITQYVDLMAGEQATLKARYSNRIFQNLQVQGFVYTQTQDISTGKFEMLEGGRVEVYGDGKISVDSVLVNSTGENDGFGLSGGESADEISIGNVTLKGSIFEGYGNVGNDNVGIDSVNVGGGSFYFFGNGNTESTAGANDADNISAQNVTVTGGEFGIESGASNDVITAANVKISNDAQFGLGGNGGNDSLAVENATVAGDAVLGLYGNEGKDTISVKNVDVEGHLFVNAINDDDGDNDADRILIDGVTVQKDAVAYVSGNIDNDIISVTNITGSGVLTVNGGTGNDSISINDSTNISVVGGDGSDTVIVGGTQILKMLAESADSAQEVAATVVADEADTVTIQENGKAYIIINKATYFIESFKRDITFKLGKFQIPDGWAGELSDGTPITLTNGTFTLNGKTYSYDSDEKVLSYVDSNGNRQAYTGNVENITAKDFVDDGTNYELKLNEIICTDGIIKLEGVTENSYFVDSNGNRIAKLSDGYLTKLGNVKQIDTTGYGKAVKIDQAFQNNTEIKTADGTFTFVGFAVVVGGNGTDSTHSITVDANGKVSGATGDFRYTLTSGDINIYEKASVKLKGEGTVNGAKFKTTTNSLITATANSAYAFSGTFTVTDSLNVSPSDVMTVENDSDGVIFTNNFVNASITGLNDGGTVTYGGKTYTRKGNYIYRDGKAYACDDKTNILQLKDGVDYLEITDSIDISKLSAGTPILDANKNTVATYDGTTLNVTGDIELKSITGLTSGKSVNYGGTTYQLNDKYIFIGADAYEVKADTNILNLSNAKRIRSVNNSMDIRSKYDTVFIKVSGGGTTIVGEYNYSDRALTIKDGTYTVETNGTVKINGTEYVSTGELKISATKDSSSLINGTITVTGEQAGVKVTGDKNGVSVTVKDSTVTNITGLNEGGTVTYNGTTYTRKDNKIFVNGKLYTVDDSTDLLNMTGGIECNTVTDTIDLRNVSTDLSFFKNGEVVASYDHNNKKLTIISGAYTVYPKTKANTVNDFTIGNEKYFGIDIDSVFKASATSSGVIYSSIHVQNNTTQAGVKVTGDSDGVKVTFRSSKITKIQYLNDGGTVTYNGKTYIRRGDKIFSGGKIFSNITNSTNLLALSGGTTYVEVTGTINLTGVSADRDFYKDGTKVATYNYKKRKLTISDGGTYTVKTSSGIAIGNESYSTTGNLEFKASKNSSSLYNGTIIVDNNTTQAGVKVTGDSDGVNVTVKNGKVTSITGLSDGGTFVYGPYNRTRTGNYIVDGRQVYEVNDNSNVIALNSLGRAQYVEYYNYLALRVIPLYDIDESTYLVRHYNYNAKGYITGDANQLVGKVTASGNNVNLDILGNSEFDVELSSNGKNYSLNGVKFYLDNSDKKLIKLKATKDYVRAVEGEFIIKDSLTLNDGTKISVKGKNASCKIHFYDGKFSNVTIDEMSSGTAIYVDDKIYSALDYMLGNGTTTLKGGKTVKVSGDSDGVKITTGIETASGKTVLASITGLSRGGKVEYDGKTYTNDGTYISDGTNQYKSDENADLLDLEGTASKMVNVDGMVFNLITAGNMIIKIGGKDYAMLTVNKGFLGLSRTYTFTKSKNAPKITGTPEFKVFPGVVTNTKVTIDFDAIITCANNVVVNGTLYDAFILNHVKVLASNGGSALYEGKIDIFDKLETADGITFHCASKNGVVTMREGKVTEVTNFTGNITGDFSNGFKINGKTVQITGDNKVTVETDGTNITAIKTISDGANVINAGGTKDIYVDSSGKACNLTILKENIKIETSSNTNATHHFTPHITLNNSGTITDISNLLAHSKLTSSTGLFKKKKPTVTLEGSRYNLNYKLQLENITYQFTGKDYDGLTVRYDTVTGADDTLNVAITPDGTYKINGFDVEIKNGKLSNGGKKPSSYNLLSSGAGLGVINNTGIVTKVNTYITKDSSESTKVTSSTAPGESFSIKALTSGGVVWQNGTGTNEGGGTTEVENYNAADGSGIQTTQRNKIGLINALTSSVYKAVGTSFINLAGGKTIFKVKKITSFSRDAAEDLNGTVDNGMLINLYTTDDAKYQLAFTDINGGTADWSNAKTDVIMQGNIHGMNSGGSNLLGGSGTNDILAGAGDNVYLGTGKNNVYLNENRNGGVGIYAYDNLIGDSSSGDSSDLADGQSADSTGEKNYSSVVNGFKFGFDYDSDILYISGKSSSRDIKQNFIEPLKEMFANLVDEINDAENDSTENSSADLAESAMIINHPISAVNKATSILRQSNRQVDLISQAVIGVNTNALSAKLNELKSTLTNLRNLTPTSIKDLTNNTSSTPNLTLEEMRQQSQQINENSTSVQDNINNATPTIPVALNLQQNNTTNKGVLDILSGNGDTKANIDLSQINTTSDQTQNNPALQQLQQQLQQEVQQLRETENGKINWSGEEKIKQEMQEIPNNSELQQWRQVAQQSAENAPITSLDTPLFAGGSSTSNNTSTTDNPTQNNPEFQQLFQQAQQRAQQAQQQAQQMQEIAENTPSTNKLSEEEEFKQAMQNIPELQQYRQQMEQMREVVENAPIISLDTPLFAGGSSTSNNTSTTDNTPSTNKLSAEEEVKQAPQNDPEIQKFQQQAEQSRQLAEQLREITENAPITSLDTPGGSSTSNNTSTTDNTPSTLDDLKSQLILIDQKDNPTTQNDSLQLTLIDPDTELKTVNNSGEVKFNDNSGNVVQIQDDSTKNDDLKSQVTLIDPKDKVIVQPYSEVDMSLEFLKHMQNGSQITFESFKRDDGDIDFKNVQLKNNSDTKSSGDAADGNDLGNVDYTKLLVGYEDGTVKTAIAGKGAVMNLDWNGDERAEEYIGDNSGVDVGEYDGTVAINLNTGVGVLDGDEAIIIGGVDKLKAGSGAAMFVGSADAPNTLMGGSGDSSIWGGGNSKDLLVGYSGEDKSGSTNFFYVKGDGKDTIESFAYLTSDNDYKADEINFLENSVTKIHIDGKDVYLTVENDDDVLKVTDAVGKDFKVRNNNTAVIAQVGTDKLTYDGRANYFYAAGKNATLTVDGTEVYNAEIWINGAKGEYYNGDIRVVDAAQVEGRTTLVGNDYDNVLIAGKGDSSMWGGNSTSNDTLIGGEGADNFFYTYGNGKDSINGATANDTVNLFEVNLEQISNVEVNAAAVKINFTDGGSLTVNGNTSGLSYRLGGDVYTVNQNTREWTKK